MSGAEITRLADRCKASVHITFNNHRSFYEQLSPNQEWEETAPEVVAEIIKRDTWVTVQFYPDTPIGSYTVHHYDLAAAIAEAHEILDAARNPKGG